MELFIGAIIILALLAVFDLMVGVSNDAVNFLNSSIGSKVTTKRIIFVIASLGMLAGVLFSKGMMEVARKGIFHPKFFTMPELIIIFLAVMLTDVILLDLYNTFGLPTSTTVSIVFELLGAAVAVSLIKMMQSANTMETLSKYINTAKAMAIILGILLSVFIAFLCGAFLQFITRLIFTFNFSKRLKRYGSLWGGFALATIVYFILIKGAKGSTFITKSTLVWIKNNTPEIFLGCVIFFTLVLQLLTWFSKINILKPIVLVGTFALAMAFAANDLVNFIGVPLAGLNAYKVASVTADPLSTPMVALQKATPSDTLLLVLAGIIMAITLWFSKKARTVTATEVNLGRQDEGIERFGSSLIARTVVRNVSNFGDTVKRFIPVRLLNFLNRRFDPLKDGVKESLNNDKPSFDLVRAAVNLMVASALIAVGTSLKLPLSTTYVTFMVAMGTSFSDRAWGRDSAVYRITGVFTVIGGWFLTALMAFFISGIFAVTIYFLKVPGVILIILIGAAIMLKNHKVHKSRELEAQEAEIFNLKKVKNDSYAKETTFIHTGHFLEKVAGIINSSYEGLLSYDRGKLRIVKKQSKKIREWASIIIANIFKTLRLVHKTDQGSSQKYAESVSAVQEIAECQRDYVRRVLEHVENNHKPLLKIQLEELDKIRQSLNNILENCAIVLKKQQKSDIMQMSEKCAALDKLINEFDKNQVKRIMDQSSKTRLSILFYGIIRDSRIISSQAVKLLKIFKDSFPQA